MYRPITEISFEQLTQLDGQPARKLKFTFDFAHEFSATNTWVDMTNQAKITFPKNIYVRDSNNKLLPLGGTQTDKLINNLFLRGDKITMSYGYWLENGDRSVTQIFTGYISKVTSKKPIQLECEDNMWLLKQVPCKRQVWPANKTIQQLVQQLFASDPTTANFTVNQTTKVNIGNFIIQNETIAQLFARLQKEYHLEFLFVKDEIRIGLSPYLQIEAVTHIFKFQQNIISDELDWQRKDDVKLSIVCKSINTTVTGINKKGENKTKKEHLSVLVYYEKGAWKYKVKEKNVDLPQNVEGERRDLFFPCRLESEQIQLLSGEGLRQYLKAGSVTALDLFELGVAELKKYYYTGFKGKFVTFGYPYVKLGDHVTLQDRLLPDRNGTYVVRGVEYTGGVNGHRQIISLDYKLFTL
jgi:hypothetical protein